MNTSEGLLPVAPLACVGVTLVPGPRGLAGPMKLVCNSCQEIVAEFDGGLGAQQWIKDGPKMQKEHVKNKRERGKGGMEKAGGSVSGKN